MGKYQSVAEKIEARYQAGSITSAERDAAIDKLADEFIAEFGGKE